MPRDEYIQLRGLETDPTPEDLGPDVWSRAHNVHWTSSAVERILGTREFAKEAAASTVPPAEPVFLLPIRTPVQAYVLAVDATGCYVLDGGTWFDISLLSSWNIAPTDGRWTGGVLNGVPFINHPDTGPFFWDLVVTNRIQLLPGWDANWRCRAMRAYKFHLFALGMVESSIDYDMKLRWSNGAEPGTLPTTWVAAADNDAGDNILAATRGAIVDAAVLRDELFIYKQFSSYRVSYTGGLGVFAFRKAFQEHGASSQNCVAEHNGFHYFWTGSDIMRHDGQSITSIARDRVRETINTNVDGGLADLVCVITVPQRDEVWVNMPETGGFSGLNKAYVYKSNMDLWSTRDLPEVKHVAVGVVPDEGAGDAWDTAADNDQSWQNWITRWDESNYRPDNIQTVGCYTRGAFNSPIAMFDQGSTALDGQQIVGQLTRESYPLANLARIKHISQVWPQFTGPQGSGLQLRIGVQRDYAAPVAWQPVRQRFLGDGKRDMIPTNATGRYISLDIKDGGDAEAQGPWRLNGVMAKVSELGRYG